MNGQTLYIPAGEIHRYENLTAKAVHVDGRLIVTGFLEAETISGQGSVDAGSLRVVSCRVHIVTAEQAVGRSIQANQGYFGSCTLSRKGVFRDYLTATSIQARELSLSTYEAARIQTERLRRISRWGTALSRLREHLREAFVGDEAYSEERLELEEQKASEKREEALDDFADAA